MNGPTFPREHEWTVPKRIWMGRSQENMNGPFTREHEWAVPKRTWMGRSQENMNGPFTREHEWAVHKRTWMGRSQENMNGPFTREYEWTFVRRETIIQLSRRRDKILFDRHWSINLSTSRSLWVANAHPMPTRPESRLQEPCPSNRQST